jgi:hypothetical protein
MWSVALASDRGLVIYYSFDAAPTDGRIVDESGRGNDGVARGATHVPAGFMGGALAFDGVDDWVEVLNPYVIEPWEQHQYSVSLWIRSESQANFLEGRAVLGDNRRYQIAAGFSAGAPVLTSHAGNFTDCCVGDPVITRPLEGAANAWRHVLLVVDEHAVPSTRLYVDGRLAGESRESGANQGGYGLLIGAVKDGLTQPGRGWIGLIDEVRIYDRMLDPSEIDRLSGVPDRRSGGELAQSTP